ncbi:Metal dependent phosphohydrolase [Desulfamplus magnetovallimortis]|uniref:Metal dependent phosphohydrolase n=1 Tax=Desulfamplus magnetovallimortis TaxID=1246637 RepID=A0A1W1H6W5_9BACT|nr:HDOD domain-containing protein [Desulfamplus magnetovallimortis]SLM28125.1 Metal dependent phosphohydrolase [Desulfamplus magnetovallimortis]
MEKKRSLIEIIDTHIQSGKVKLPVMNQNSLQVQKEISKKDPDLDHIINLIKRDVSLAAEVLRLSNSSFYKGLEPVKTVQEAVVRLGIVEVTNIVLLTSQKSTFQSRDKAIQEFMKQLWIHSVGCAVGAQWIAKQSQYPNLNEAFLSGLLHDVGAFMLLSVMDQIKAKNATFPKKLMEDIVLKMHPKYGNMLLKIWNLPEQYCTIAKDHHDYEFDDTNILLVIIRFADKLCQHLGIGIGEIQNTDVYSCEEASILDINEVAIAQLEIKMEDSMHLV